MDNFYKLILSTKVSLVIFARDDYTAKPCAGGNISISLAEYPRKRPVRKAGGYYVFTDLPEGTYNGLIRSDVYMEEPFTVATGDLDPGNPVIYINLKPCSYYPFPQAASVIRASVRDKDGRGLRNVRLSAVMVSDNCARTRLSGEKAEKGQNLICTTNGTAGILAGDEYLIRDKDDEANAEFCRIACTAGEKCYRVDNPLQSSHARGSLLLPVVRNYSDERGEAVIYFREPCPDSFKVKLEFNHCENLIVKEFEMEGGKEFNLGVINMG